MRPIFRGGKSASTTDQSKIRCDGNARSGNAVTWRGFCCELASQNNVPIKRRHTASLFTPPHAITAYIISVGTSSSHSASAPPSPRLISPRFLFSSTRKIPPSEKCSRECHDGHIGAAIYSPTAPDSLSSA